jgi:transcriptional regulator with XRE-family HTH domain
MVPGSSSPPTAATSLRRTLAVNLVALRRKTGWSQEALALEAGLHRTFVAHVERGARNISIDNIGRLAAAFDVAPFELLRPLRDKR